MVEGAVDLARRQPLQDGDADLDDEAAPGARWAAAFWKTGDLASWVGTFTIVLKTR